MNIYLDIETRPTGQADIQEKLIAGIKPPGNYKSQEAITKWWAENGEAQKSVAIMGTALDGLWGEICCIGFAIDDGPVLTIVDNPEANILTAWSREVTATVKAVYPASADAMWDDRLTWVGHNVQDFDIRFLRQRCIINQVRLGFRLPIERYPNGPWIFDTMKEWAGYGKYVKQSALELAFGLERNDPLKGGGADVAGAFIGDIQMHCAEDVRLVREIHRRMKP